YGSMLMAMRWILVISSLSLAFGTLAAAQGTASPVGGDAVANPGRPTVTTPATLTPVGFLQFESGGIEAWQSPEFSTRLGLSETVKLAVAPRLQLLAVTDPAALSKSGGTTSAGLADYFLGAQAVIHPGD